MTVFASSSPAAPQGGGGGRDGDGGGGGVPVAYPVLDSNGAGAGHRRDSSSPLSSLSSSTSTSDSSFPSTKGYYPRLVVEPRASSSSYPSNPKWGRRELLISALIFTLLLAIMLSLRWPIRRPLHRNALPQADPAISIGAHDAFGGGLLTNLAALPSGGSLTVQASNDDYGAYDARAASLYGFDLLLEPYRPTTLKASTSDDEDDDDDEAKYVWFVGVLDSETETEGQKEVSSILYRGQGEDDSIQVTCTSPGSWLTVYAERVSSDGTKLYYKSSSVVCRYVRREIRDLTEADRQAYFDALDIMYRTDLEEGQAKYGDNFHNYQEFTIMHNSVKYCYHGGDQFITSHGAFTQMFDESLQTIEPRLTQPYWDFMLDSGTLGEEWHTSVIYSDDWFGSISNTGETGYSMASGRFTQLPMARNDSAVSSSRFVPDSNMQGFISNRFNLNSYPHVQRTRSMCGIMEGQYLATCDTFISCFEDYQTLSDWALCLEVNVHANMHEWHGGAFQCAVDLSKVQEEHPQYSTGLLQFLGTVAHDVWFIYNRETVSKYMECPSECPQGSSDARDGCCCYCSLDFDEMDSESVQKIMAGTLYTLQFIFFEGSTYILPDETLPGVYMFATEDGPLSSEDNERLLRIAGKMFCSGGQSGPLGTGAAPNDPIFWPLHPIFDRAWHVLLLADRYSSTYDYTWTDKDCYGSAWEDEQAFKNLMGDTSGTYYTNQQLWALLSPSNSGLPYVYDNFDLWGTCEWSQD